MTPEHVGTWLVTVTDDGRQWTGTAVELGGDRAATCMSAQSAYAAAADALGSAMPEPDEVPDEAMSCPVCGEPAGICECPVCPWGNRDCPNPGAPQGSGVHAECMPSSERERESAPAPKCPVTILGARCGATIAAGGGELVMHGGKGWLVCANCAQRGVREDDVANATPDLGL